MHVDEIVMNVIRQVAERAGYTFDELIAVDTHKHVTAVRQYAMWKARERTKLPATRLAILFDRTAETVTRACRLVEALPKKKRGVFPPRPSLQIERIKPFVRPIIEEEAARNGYSFEELRSVDRTLHLTSVRQYAMWRAKKETGRTLVEIGRVMKRDHTTVLHAVRKVEAIPEELRGVFPPKPVPARRVFDPYYGKKFEGKPCPFGHTLRYFSSGCCVACRVKKGQRQRVASNNFYAEAAE